MENTLFYVCGEFHIFLRIGMLALDESKYGDFSGKIWRNFKSERF